MQLLEGETKAEQRLRIIIESINALKRRRVTAVKIEAEAQFNRGRTDHFGREICGFCYGQGTELCTTCEGDWEDRVCATCGGKTYYTETFNKAKCIYILKGCTRTTKNARECYNCDEEGRQNCGNCNQGRMRCTRCLGNREIKDMDWHSTEYCQDYILEQLSYLGLAEPNTDPTREQHANYNRWRPVMPLVFCRFYNDGSVDSEFTFTLSIANSEDVYLLPKIIEAFNELGLAIGQGSDLHGAGMHTALLFDPKCRYGNPEYAIPANELRFQNFTKSMGLLIPALYFLASPNENSRSIHCRQPQISSREKYSTVCYHYGGLEFRVFDTCYDNPEQILDNLVVIKNCMRYWSRTPIRTGLEKIASSITFGHDEGNDLKRFYTSVEHIDILNAGLMRLKPAYMSIKEVKAQRKFDVNKITIKGIDKKVAKEAETEYAEYEERYEWDVLIKREQYKAEQLNTYKLMHSGSLTQINKEVVLKEIDDLVEQRVENIKRVKKGLKAYVNERVKARHQTNDRFTLTA